MCLHKNKVVQNVPVAGCSGGSVFLCAAVSTVCSCGCTVGLWKCTSVCVCVVLCSVVTGAHRAAVASAVTRIEVLIDSFRRKQPFTHFLSFALNHPQVQEGFLRFREEVLEQCGQVRESEWTECTFKVNKQSESTLLLSNSCQ